MTYTAIDKFKDFKEGIQKLEEAERLMSGGPATYHIDQLIQAYSYMMERFSPFHIGDRVELASTPSIDPGSGWYSHRHFLVKGSKGIIRSEECDERGFGYDVEFDNQTWIDRQGKEQPVGDKGLFWFREQALSR